MNLFLDIGTGQFRRTLNGAPLAAVKFFAGDIASIGITLVDGKTEVTSTTITGGKRLRCVLRGYPLTDDPLAEAELSTVTGEIVSGDLEFDADRVAEYFTDFVPASEASGGCIFEVQLETSNASSIETLAQARSLVVRDLVTIATVRADFNPSDFSSSDFATS